MEFGMFHQFPAIPGRTQQEAFAEGFAQIDAAERWGLDAIWLAELHFDPLRIAEEAATVDHISSGRLIFGVGRSGLPRTYEDYGVSYAESRDRFIEVLDILELAWTRAGFSYEGKYYAFKNITVAPQPLQQPYPPIRIAAASPDTYPAVGARGLPIFINARYGSFAEFAPEIRAYRQACKAAGHEGR